MDLSVYQNLEERVKAGEYLPKGNLAKLLDMPSNSTEETIRFYEECNRTLELYRQKLQIYETREKAASQLSDAANMVGEVSLKIAKFNTELSDEYEQYKKESADKIDSLRADLAESKDISTNALNRCDELGEQVKKLETEKRQLKKKLEEKEEELAYYESDIPKGYIIETDDGVLGMCAEEKQDSARLADLKEENATLKAMLADNENKGMVEMAHLMIQNGIDYLADVKKVSDDDKSSFGEKVLKHTISGKCETYLEQQEIDKLRNAIGHITDKREEAQETVQKKEEENRERMASAKPFHIDTVKQFNAGQGLFKETDHSTALPDKSDGMK